MRRLFQGGTLIDGTGAPARQADVLVKDGCIEAVGHFVSVPDAETIDISGKTIAPAFVDMHRHIDAKPLMDSSMEVELRQGIATTVAGNCGFSLAPLGGEFASAKREAPSWCPGPYSGCPAFCE